MRRGIRFLNNGCKLRDGERPPVATTCTPRGYACSSAISGDGAGCLRDGRNPRPAAGQPRIVLHTPSVARSHNATATATITSTSSRQFTTTFKFPAWSDLAARLVRPPCRKARVHNAAAGCDSYHAASRAWGRQDAELLSPSSPIM
jgi:hypothetical protein